jgi:hypothetical protein
MGENKNKMKGLVFVLFLLIFPTLGHAWSSEEIFSHFQPYITVQEEYNSNIDLSQNRYKRDDFITTIFPGFKFSTAPRSPITGDFRPTPTAGEKYGVDLDFRAGFNFYAKNHEENYTSLNGLLNAWYAVTPRLNFRVRDYVIRSDEIREAEYSSTSIEGQYLPSRTRKREPYIRNVLEPSVQYQFGRDNVIEFNYRNNVYHIQSRTSEDSMENFFNPKITYWFDIRNGVSLEYGLTLGNFQGSPDLVGHMATGRYTYRFNPRTSIFGEYTQMWRNFDNPGTDYAVYRPSLGMEHAFSPTLSVKIQGGYFWENPERGSTVEGPFYDILLTQRGKRTTYTLSFQGGYTEDYFTAENQGFTQYHRALGRVTYQLLRQMNVGLFGSYEWAKYPGSVVEDKEPKDQTWAVGVNASYQILKWLNASLDVSHRENRSNISDREYSEYRGMIKVTATY